MTTPTTLGAAARPNRAPGPVRSIAMRSHRIVTIALLTVVAMLSACGSDDATGDGVRLVSVDDGADIRADPPEDLVVLDVRTPEEFAEGHIEDAVLIDFYAEDFADRLEELDRDVPYLLYCRSGNRSGQVAEMMEELGFTDVADVDGGIVAWIEAGHPVVQ